MSDNERLTVSAAATKEPPAMRVARGAARLDERVPDWFRRVDLSKILMWDDGSCVLAQVCGSYHDGLASLYLHGTYGDDPNPGMSDAGHGFDIFYDGTENETTFEQLTAAWHDEITARLRDVGGINR